MRLPLTDYTDLIQHWVADSNIRHFHHQVTDDEIWVRIGVLWPTLSPHEKHTIFQGATHRRYQPLCYPSTSSFSLQSRLSYSELPTTYRRNKLNNKRKPKS